MTEEEDLGPEGGAFEMPRPEAGEAGNPDARRAYLLVEKGGLHSAGDGTIAHVAAVRPPVIYTWGEVLASIIYIPDAQRPHEVSPAPRAHVLDQHALAELLNRHVAFHKLIKKGNSDELVPAPTDCPGQMSRWLLSRGQWSGVLPLAGIREAPALLANGRIVDAPGYDAASGLYLDLSHQFPEVPRKPTKDQAVASLHVLEELLEGFPFCESCDKSAAFASIITGITRTAYSYAPLFLAIAPVQSSGKSTLSALPALITTTKEPHSISPGNSEEEADKRIIAALSAGRSFISLDNLVGEFELTAIARAISEPTYAGRILGISKTVDLPTTATMWTGSGNGVVPRGDLVSRTIPIRLDPRVEKPWLLQRANRDPRLVAVERRGEFVASAMTIARAYDVAGRPDQGLSGYRLREWSDLVRSPLVWLGLDDPLAGMRESEDRDPVTELLGEFMAAWKAVIGLVAATVSDAIDRARDNERFGALLRTVSRSSKVIEPRRVGKYLSANERRIVGGLRFQRAGTLGAAVLWQLAVVEDGVSSVREVSRQPTRERSKEAEEEDTRVGSAEETTLTDQTDVSHGGKSSPAASNDDTRRSEAPPRVRQVGPEDRELVADAPAHEAAMATADDEAARWRSTFHGFAPEVH